MSNSRYLSKTLMLREESGELIFVATAIGEGSSQPPPPIIASGSTAFSPSSGAIGASFTISGQHFTGATSVKIGGVSATFMVNNDHQITVTIPSGTVSSFVEVATPRGTVTSSNQFTVLQLPMIYTFQPSYGGIYTNINIYGENLDGVYDVQIGGSSMSINYANSTQINAVLTSSMPAGQYPIEIYTSNGVVTTENIGYFTVANEYGGWNY